MLLSFFFFFFLLYFLWQGYELSGEIALKNNHYYYYCYYYRRDEKWQTLNAATHNQDTDFIEEYYCQLDKISTTIPSICK